MLRGIRVYELARELDISSKDILRLLSDKMHIEMNNHMATLNDQVVARLRQLVAEERGQDGAQKAGTRGPRPSADEPRPAPEAAGGAPQSGARAPAPTPRAPAPGNHPPAAVRPPAAAAPLGGRAAARPGAPAVRSTPPPPRSGPVHFRPAPGLLPLVTPRPTPPRPRRPQPRPEPAPTLTHSPAAAETPQPEAPVPAPAAAAPVPQEPQTAPQRVEPAAAPAEGAPIPAAAQEAHPAEAPAAVPPEPQSTREEPREVPPEPERAAPPEPEPVRAAAQQAPTAPSEEPATGTGQQLAPAVSHPTPAVARPSLPIVTQSAAARARPEVESGAAPARALLPVRRVQPGQPPPLRYPDRPLLPVRKVDPNAPRPAPAASSAPATATAPAAGHPGAGRRGRRGEHVGVPAEGGGTTLDVRRRGGAGRRPARPGAVTAGEGEWGEAGRRLRRRRGRRLAAAAAEAQAPVMPESVTFSGPVLVSELAEMLSVGAPEVIRKLLDRGVMAAIHHQVDVEHARAVAEDYGISVQVAGGAGEEAPATVDRDTLGALLAGDDPHRVEPRPPIVTVLGHVDHGKTTLLDAIRKTRVAAGEAGGITQHIGAYRVRHGERTVVFLDTPGHEAFTAMRARGAQVTDIAVLVVAADDGVMPQTREALSHARAAGVPVVVALNKVDKPDANVDRVLQQLSEVGLVPEAWGGDSIVVPVSALKGEGIDALLEMLLLVADMEDLRADPQRAAVGTVIEAEVSRGRGPVATVLVQAGTLRVGDTFVAGQVFGRVRAMIDDMGQPVRAAGPSAPVEVLGFDAVPSAGDVFQVLPEREARETAQNRQDNTRREGLLTAERAVSLEEFHQASEDDAAAEDLGVILKADVQGSLEAVRGALEKLHNEELRVVVLHAGVGPVNESDVMLAAASRAVILGFNVRPDSAAEREAQRVGVEVKTYRVIYELLDEVQRALDGRLKPKYETVTIGHAEVRRPIRVPDVGVIAGSFVLDGVARRGARVRVLRQGTIVHEGTLASLRRFKDDAREVAAGFECGIGLERWNDVKEGDVIEVLEEREVPR